MGSRAEVNGELQNLAKSLESLTEGDKAYLESMNQELLKLSTLLTENIIPQSEKQEASSLPRQDAWQRLDIIRLKEVPTNILELLNLPRYTENLNFLKELNHKDNTQLTATYNQEPSELFIKVINLRSVLLFFLNHKK